MHIKRHWHQSEGWGWGWGWGRSYLFSSSSWLANSTLSFCVLASMALTCWRLPSFSETYCRQPPTSARVTALSRPPLHPLLAPSVPAHAVPWRRPAPSPLHRCGWWPWPSRLAQGPSRPAAARCVAASPSAPPAVPWCPRSCGRSATMSRSAAAGGETLRDYRSFRGFILNFAAFNEARVCSLLVWSHIF